MSSLKSTDTQKTDTDYSAQTATSQWVCMDIVRTLKVSFEGKEYDFIELSDGSLVWNENLEPYRKQQKLNVAENVLKYGTGGINIDESRVGTDEIKTSGGRTAYEQEDKKKQGIMGRLKDFEPLNTTHAGRFPANLITDGSEEVRECFPETGSPRKARTSKRGGSSLYGSETIGTPDKEGTWPEDNGGNASRFFKSIPIEEQDEIQEECTDMEEKLEKLGLEQQDLQKNTDEYWNNQSVYTKSIIYQAKASKSERTVQGTITNQHPTIKPIALMKYLIKMVTPTGGTVLDPFAGSGSTLVAAKQNGFNYIGIEMTAEYIPIIEARLSQQGNLSLLTQHKK
jgi:site-specific DNA-methyltransferase (adenine-specific)